MNKISEMSKGFVTINGNHFKVSLALTEQEQTHGLMHIEPPLTSMAFIYTTPHMNRFWMNNVKDDLDIVFCYKGKIVEIIEANALDTTLVGSPQYTDLVLEFPTIVRTKYGFNVDDDVKLSISKEAVKKLNL